MNAGRSMLPLLLAGAAGLAGCGDDGGDRGVGRRSTADSRPARVPAAKLRDALRARAPAAVVRGWADTLRSGDADGAARFFFVPAVVSNGGPPTRLTTARQIVLFNESLPCGAKVIATEPATRGFLIVTFVLTERPGPGVCGAGTATTARTAFRVRGGRITHWVRVQDIPPAPKSTI